MTQVIEGRVEVVQIGQWWMLSQQLRYRNDEVEVIVPEGFVTDFASIPRPLWSIFPPTDARYSVATIIHDRLYETHELSRAGADELMCRISAMTGTPAWKRRAMFAAVRAFGGQSYATGPDRQKARVVAYHAITGSF